MVVLNPGDFAWWRRHGQAGFAAGIQWVEARGVSEHRTVHRAGPHDKQLSGENLKSTEVENLSLISLFKKSQSINAYLLF